jgi:hypothetical protein
LRSWNEPSAPFATSRPLEEDRSVTVRGEDSILCRAGSLPLLFDGGSGSRYADGANGKSIHHQIIETYLLMFEAVAEVGIEEGLKV